MTDSFFSVEIPSLLQLFSLSFDSHHAVTRFPWASTQNHFVSLYCAMNHACVQHSHFSIHSIAWKCNGEHVYGGGQEFMTVVWSIFKPIQFTWPADEVFRFRPDRQHSEYSILWPWSSFDSRRTYSQMWVHLTLWKSKTNFNSLSSKRNMNDLLGHHFAHIVGIHFRILCLLCTRYIHW